MLECDSLVIRAHSSPSLAFVIVIEIRYAVREGHLEIHERMWPQDAWTNLSVQYCKDRGSPCPLSWYSCCCVTALQQHQREPAVRRLSLASFA